MLDACTGGNTAGFQTVLSIYDNNQDFDIGASLYAELYSFATSLQS